jgi:hypothetical protein
MITEVGILGGKIEAGMFGVRTFIWISWWNHLRNGSPTRLLRGQDIIWA